METLKQTLASLLSNNKERLLDEYIEKLRTYFKSVSTGARDSNAPDWLFQSLRIRFSDLLDREISYLTTGQYDISTSLEDVSHAVRIIPFCSQDPRSRRLSVTLELFVETVSSYILSQLKMTKFSSYRRVAPLLNRLAYFAYEDLWVTTIVSHKFHRSLIQKLLMKTISAHEDERHKLAQALHDGVLQSLASAIVRTDVLQKMVESGDRDNALMDEILDLRRIISDTIKKIRNINHTLHPLNLAKQGLVLTVKSYLESFEKETGISARIVSPPLNDIKWSREVQASVYRIIQELLVNVRKHSKAKHVRISLSAIDSRISVSVEDDGVGFDLSKVLADLNISNSFGLLSIGEQTNIWGGSMRIQSSPGQGTLIEIEVPIHAKI